MNDVATVAAVYDHRLGFGHFWVALPAVRLGLFKRASPSRSDAPAVSRGFQAPDHA
jgi:hypothetical protein